MEYNNTTVHGGSLNPALEYISGDTIVAISSSPGNSIRGVVRLSGPEAFAIASNVFVCDVNPAITLDKAEAWRNISGRCMLDEKVSFPVNAYLFNSPHSYTTEDMVELHLPGNQLLLTMVLRELVSLGARIASPGEFTARAFFSGRIDLTEAEAVAQMIGAKSDSQLRASQRLLDGELHSKSLDISGRLTDILSLVEAEIDFSQEEIEFASADKLLEMIGSVKASLGNIIDDSISVEQLGQLPWVAIAGAANAGKSSIINRLLGIDRSIVSATAGSTRDMLTAPMAIYDGECMLVDTAGLGSVTDPLAGETQRLSHQAIAAADMLIWVIDISDITNPAIMPPDDMDLPENVLFVANKIDLVNNFSEVLERLLKEYNCRRPSVGVSAINNIGLDGISGYIKDEFRDNMHLDSSISALALTLRQRGMLDDAMENIDLAMDISKGGLPEMELLALYIRNALDDIGCISGQVATDDVLGNIFGKFCIGK